MSETGLWNKIFGSIACLFGMSIIVLWFFREEIGFLALLWLAIMALFAGVLALAGSPFAPRTQRERVVGRVRVLRDPAIEPRRSEPPSQAPVTQDPGDSEISGQVDKLEAWIRGS